MEEEQALKVLERDALSNAGLIQVLRRGTGDLLRAEDSGILVRDTVSGLYLLAKMHGEGAQSWMRDFQADLIRVVSDSSFAAAVKAERNAEWMAECDQYVYQGGCPAEPELLRIAEVTQAELDVVAENYEILTHRELEQVAARHMLFAGHDASGAMVGFVGSHLEGSMGILEIFPSYRQKGYAVELEHFIIRYFLQNSLIPFGEVITDNTASTALQRKLGMTKALRRAYWIGME